MNQEHNRGCPGDKSCHCDHLRVDLCDYVAFSTLVQTLSAELAEAKAALEKAPASAPDAKVAMTRAVRGLLVDAVEKIEGGWMPSKLWTLEARAALKDVGVVPPQPDAYHTKPPAQPAAEGKAKLRNFHCVIAGCCQPWFCTHPDIPLGSAAAPPPPSAPTSAEPGRAEGEASPHEEYCQRTACTRIGAYASGFCPEHEPAPPTMLAPTSAEPPVICSCGEEFTTPRALWDHYKAAKPTSADEDAWPWAPPKKKGNPFAKK